MFFFRFFQKKIFASKTLLLRESVYLTLQTHTDPASVALANPHALGFSDASVGSGEMSHFNGEGCLFFNYDQKKFLRFFEKKMAFVFTKMHS